MNRYVVHTSGGHNLTIEAHHFVINEESGRLEFYKSETEKDDRWIIFLSGLVAIEVLQKADWKMH